MTNLTKQIWYFFTTTHTIALFGSMLMYLFAPGVIGTRLFEDLNLDSSQYLAVIMAGFALTETLIHVIGLYGVYKDEKHGLIMTHLAGGMQVLLAIAHGSFGNTIPFVLGLIFGLGMLIPSLLLWKSWDN